MQIDYRRDIYHNYLILSGGEEPDTSSYQVRILMANQINGFLPCQIQQIDQKILFYYDITSKQSLQTMLEHRQIKKDMLELLLEQIAAALETVKNYLLNINGFLLKPEFIFSDASGGKIWFCYYPGAEMTFQNQIRELSEYLLPKLEHQDREAVMLGYVFYQKCVEETITAEIFQELLHRKTWEESRIGAEIPKLSGPGTEGRAQEKENMPSSREELLDAFFEPEETEQKVPVGNSRYILLFAGIAAAAGILAVFGAAGYLAAGCLLAGGAAGIGVIGFTVKRTMRENKERESEMEKYLRIDWAEEKEHEKEEQLSEEPKQDGSEETVYLAEAAAGKMAGSRACLVPEGDSSGNIIYLDKEVCLVGKEQGAADVLLPFPAVSRLHARMVWNGETYLLSDLNSRNGTEVNGKLLEMGEACALVSGDRIRFANLTYRFQE